MVVDISARKRLEAQFRQAQKMEALGRLAGGVAHDFNNLLTAISGFASLLLDDLQDSELRSYAEEVRLAATRAGSLTRQLLAFSRQQTVQSRSIDLNEVVTQSANLLRRVIGEDVRLVTHLTPGLWKTRMDPGQVEQVIMNLAVNARDAMPAGGALTIETSNMELDANYTGRILGVPAGSYVLLTVSDTGTGMTPEIRERLFEPFFTTKPAGKGTGLGLSIVYGVVKQSQGEIIVYSEPGQGTTFKLYLPRNEAQSDESPEAETGSMAPGSETILLAEDEESVRNMVTTVLRQHGYTVLVADSPAQAEELSDAFAQHIHILLTDLVMPGRGGCELYASLHERRSDLKVLYMSGYTENSLVQRALLDDTSSFLQKPFTTATLLGKLREVLGAEGSAGSEEEHHQGNGA
jgi:nitrogen-specific signal transduction histidine kinase/ActR/RegA family two-component response regulator